jgi:hypothetical protein
MIELKSADQLQKAIETARKAKLFIKPSSLFRQYVVENRQNGRSYIINFFVRAGKRFGHCDCAAGERNLACKHLAASAGYYMMRAEQMRSH